MPPLKVCTINNDDEEIVEFECQVMEEEPIKQEFKNSFGLTTIYEDLEGEEDDDNGNCESSSGALNLFDIQHL